MWLHGARAQLARRVVLLERHSDGKLARVEHDAKCARRTECGDEMRAFRGGCGAVGIAARDVGIPEVFMDETQATHRKLGMERHRRDGIRMGRGLVS